MLVQIKTSWDFIVDEWLGSTALPTYDPTLPNEEGWVILDAN